MTSYKPSVWGFGTTAAVDEDWASLEFDHLQPHIARLLDPTYPVGDLDRQGEAQRWRDARPYLVAHLRRAIGDPKWDPRGARVRSLRGPDRGEGEDA